MPALIALALFFAAIGLAVAMYPHEPEAEAVSKPLRSSVVAKLAELSPRFRPMAEGVLRDLDAGIARGGDLAGVSWFVGDAFRSLAKSAELFAAYQRGGPRAAPPGESAHNFAEGLDVNLSRGGVVIASISDPAWQAFGRIARARGVKWGGDWSGQKDGPHIEHPDWRNAPRVGGNVA